MGCPTKALSFLILVPLAQAIFAQAPVAGDRNWTRNNPSLKGVIVFVHGFLGDAKETWTSKGKKSFPELVAEDKAFENFNIYSHQYSTTLTSGGFSIDQICDNMKLRLDAAKVTQHESLVFVAHSLGGNVVRAFLLKYREYAPKVRFLYFFSTPTTGTSIANLVAKIPFNSTQLRQLTVMDAESRLSAIQSDWMAWETAKSIQSYCAYETKKTYGVLIVDQSSSTNLCNARNEPLQEDHISIVKPDGKDSDAFLSLRNAMEATESKKKPLPPSKPARGPSNVANHNRSEPIRVSCTLVLGGFPCQINCQAENGTMLPVKDLYVGFDGFYPAGTLLASESSTEAYLLPKVSTPLLGGNERLDRMVDGVRAFNVHLPRIPPNSSVRFAVYTNDKENIKACDHSLRLFDLIKLKLEEEEKDFHSWTSKRNASVPTANQIDAVFRKRWSIFKPFLFSHVAGKGRVDFISRTDQETVRQYESLRTKVRSKLDIASVGNEVSSDSCEAPVYGFERLDGTRFNTVLYLPKINTFYTWTLKRAAEGGTPPIEIPIPIQPPIQYRCSQGQSR